MPPAGAAPRLAFPSMTTLFRRRAASVLTMTVAVVVGSVLAWTDGPRDSDAE